MKISHLRAHPTLWNKNGVSFLALFYLLVLMLRKSPKFLSPPPPPPPRYMPLSRSCQTPKVINPSVRRTNSVVLRNSIINCFLMAPFSFKIVVLTVQTRAFHHDHQNGINTIRYIFHLFARVLWLQFLVQSWQISISEYLEMKKKHT